MLVIVIFYAFLLNKNSVNTYGNNMLADSCCEQLCTVHVILYTVLHIVTVATYKCFALLPPSCRGLWSKNLYFKIFGFFIRQGGIFFLSFLFRQLLIKLDSLLNIIQLLFHILDTFHFLK